MKDQLNRYYEKLGESERQSLLAFAEFLFQRQSDTDTVPLLQEAQAIERPDNERVPAALKRLKATYPMLEASDLLGEASELVTQFLMQGREAVDVIDDLEALFERHYELYKSGITK